MDAWDFQSCLENSGKAFSSRPISFYSESLNSLQMKE